MWPDDTADLPDLADPAVAPLPMGLPGGPLPTPVAPPPPRPGQAPPQQQGGGGLGALAQILPLIALAAKHGGRAGIAGLLHGIQQAQARQQQQARLGQQDARQSALDQSNADARQQQLMLQSNQQTQSAEAQRQQRAAQVRQQFATALQSIDDPNAIPELARFFAADGTVPQADLERFAMTTISPSGLQKKTSQKKIDDLKKLHGEKWIEMGPSFSYQMPNEEQPISFQELLRRAGETQVAPLPSQQQNDPDLSKSSLSVQAAAALRRGDTEEYQRLLRVQKELGQADDRPATLSAMNALYGAIDPKAIADAIRAGEAPPEIAQYGRPAAAAIASELAKPLPSGARFDLSSAQRTWKAQLNLNRTMNAAQQVRLDESIRSGLAMYDQIDTLADAWDGHGWGPLSRANLAAAMQGVKGQDAQRVAVQLTGEIAQLTSDVATIEQGGLTPTEEARKVAQQSLQAWWSRGTIRAMTAQGRWNMQARELARRTQATQVPGNEVDRSPAVPSTPATTKIGRFDVTVHP